METLGIELWIENISDSELMINDMERGLTWYILPGQSANFKVNNPEVTRWRICKVNTNVVRYVTAAAGSSVKKWEIGWEDDECWVVAVFKKGTFHELENQIGYRRISKADFSETEMTIQEFDKFKKEKKKENP